MKLRRFAWLLAALLCSCASVTVPLSTEESAATEKPKAEDIEGYPQEERIIGLPGDTREIPSLRAPYGDVPLVHLSAGIQRIVSLADKYFLLLQVPVVQDISHRDDVGFWELIRKKIT